MATTSRGKVLRELESRGRGTCPSCGRTRIKLLYELSDEIGVVNKVCKNCRPKKGFTKSKS